MRTLLSAGCFLLAAFAVVAQPVKYTGWTTNNNAAAARGALGLGTNSDVGFGTITIGTGAGAVTWVAGADGLATDAKMSAGTFESSTNNVNYLNVTNALTITPGGTVTINGESRTTWPDAGGFVNNGEATEFYISFQTNYSPVVGSALTNLGYFTNGFARADWTATNGSVLSMEYSTDNTNWTATIAYNSAAWLRLVVQLASLNPGTEAVTNFTVWSVLNIGTLGYTNDYTLQTLRVADPVSESDAASKAYADATALNNATIWSTHPAQADVQMRRQPLRPDELWQLGRSVTNNEVRLAFTFAGNELLTLSPGFTGISNGVSITATGAVAYIAVATNNAPGPFRVLCSSNNWQWFTEITVTNSYPTASGTNYLLTFPAPVGAGSWIYQVGRSNAASISGLGIPQMASAMLQQSTAQVFVPAAATYTNVNNYAASKGVYGCDVNLSAGTIVNQPAGTYRITFRGTTYSTNTGVALYLFTNGQPCSVAYDFFRLTSAEVGSRSTDLDVIIDLPANTTNQIKFTPLVGFDGRAFTNGTRFFSLQQIR